MELHSRQAGNSDTGTKNEGKQHEGCGLKLMRSVANQGANGCSLCLDRALIGSRLEVVPAHCRLSSSLVKVVVVCTHHLAQGTCQFFFQISNGSNVRTMI